jgi:DNA repair protein RAD57
MEDAKISTTTLADRSRNLSAIAAQLHALASTHQLAVVAINRVTDVWERRPDSDMGFPGELIYADHARLFGRASEADGALSKKSAALGLVWANQVNARIMLTRTERRHHYYDYRYDRHNPTHSHRHYHGAPPGAAATAQPSEGHHDSKRQRLDEDEEDVVQVVVVRRLTVVFSSVCAPASVDFIVTSRGVEILVEDLDENVPAPAPALTNVTMGRAAPAGEGGVGRPPQPPLAEVSPLDVGSVVGDFRPPHSRPQPRETSGGEVEAEDEDEDAYWREVDDFPFSGDGVDLVMQGTNPS